MVLLAAIVVVLVVVALAVAVSTARRGSAAGPGASMPTGTADIAGSDGARPPTTSVGEAVAAVDDVDEHVDMDATAPDVDLGAVLRAAVNELEIGVVVCDAFGDIVYRNQTAAALGGTHVGLIVDEHLDGMLAQARSGERASKLIDLHGPPQMWLALEAEPMPEGAAVATFQDVSERVRIDTMRTDFVANISHELRTPVGAIAVLAETLSEEDSIEVVHRISERLVREAHRAVRTIDDLLELSRIESARVNEDFVDLRDVVQAAIVRGRVADDGRGIDVSAFAVGQHITLRADRRQLLSAIGNLVENAVKYSEDGGQVQVRTRVDERYVEVMVADQGVGIPQRDLDRIFERFYRVDKARSRETGGTGLGLAIVRHVATNHGGDVLVSSTEGEGSTFVLRLPASLVTDSSSHTETLDGADESSEKESSS